mmetsp:Transcript_7422/g.8169  ORF Transcript_7422/g.8169 Transcript_7422/m.8169 type:complete len:491 (-) Transcript_7422:1616-3088(-)
MFLFKKRRKESLFVVHRVCITSCHYMEPKRFYFQANNNIIPTEQIQIRRSSRQSYQRISKEQRRTYVKPSRSRLWGEMSLETKTLAQAIMNSNHNTNTTFSEDEDEDEDDANNRNHSGNCNDNRNGKATSQYEIKRKRHKIKMHPRVAISRAITLMESKHPFKKKQGDLLLTYLLSLSLSNNHDQKATLRIGFAGPPGAGKSCLIETFGMKLLQQNPDLKIAVVCIDPSSNISGGSILGDKTRMTQLSRQVDRALVRPSSNSGILGGLAAYTDDVVRLLGCAGYPIVFVETVGLGQSEKEIVQSVDVLVLLVPPSGGDELQGVKKGIVEMANILAVTKTDGDLEAAAFRTASDYKGALGVLQQSSRSSGSDNSRGGHGTCSSNIWKPPVILTSSVSQRGLDDLWQAIIRYKQHLLDTEKWDHQRRKQSQYWMWKQFTRMMQTKMQQELKLKDKANQLEREMLDGLLTPRVAAQELLDEIFDLVNKKDEQP